MTTNNTREKLEAGETVTYAQILPLPSNDWKANLDGPQPSEIITVQNIVTANNMREKVRIQGTGHLYNHPTRRVSSEEH